MIDRKIFRGRKLHEAIIIAFGIILSVAVYYGMYLYESRGARHELDEATENINVALEAEIELNFESLRSIRGLFNSSTNVTRDEFRIFVDGILYRHNEIQALEWIPRITHAKRSSYEARVRKERFPEFRITQRAEQGHMIPDRKRKEYFPVDYMEPIIGNESALGFNLGSSKSRLTTLQKARDTGKFVMTGRITLVQEKEEQSGFLIFLPVYKGQPVTVVERRKALQGFVLGVYRAGDLVTRAISRVTGSNIEDMNLQVFDESPEGKLQLLYAKSDTESVKPLLYSSYSIAVGGRIWKVVHTAGPVFIDSHRTYLPLFLLIVTNVIAFLIYFYTGARAGAAAERVENEKRMARFFDASMEGLFFHDQGVILDVNENAASMFGYDRDEIIGRTLFDFTDPAYHELAKQKIQNGSTDPWEMRCIAKDGTRVPVEVQAGDTVFGDKAARIVAIRDITQRKQMEQESRKQNEFTEHVLETVGSLVIVLDREGKIVRFNNACEQLSGYSAAEVMGRHVWDFLLRADAIDGVTEVFNSLKAGNFPSQYQNFWITKTGEEKIIDWLNTALVDQDGSVEFVIATGLDVTDRLRMENELSKEQSQKITLATELTQLIDTANAPIFGVNKLGRINEWNRKMAEITGYEKKEVMNCNLVDEFIGKEYKEPVSKILDAALVGEETENYELPIFGKTKHRVLILLNATTRRDIEGNITGVIGIGQDITELAAYRSSMEQKVSERTQELNTIFSLSPDGFVLINEDHKIIYANPAFLEMTGFDMENVIGISESQFSEKMYSLQDIDRHPEQCRIGDIERSEILNLKRPSTKTLKCTLRSVKNDKGLAHGSVLYFRDITHEEEVDRMKSEFLSTAAHELRTPLASILGFSELLLHRDYEEAQRKDVTETIYRQSVNLKNLLDELLDLARIEARAGKDFNLQPGSLQGVLEEVCKEFEGLHANRVVKKDFKEPWAVVVFDYAKMQQAIRNVMSNAFKYSGEEKNVECSTIVRKIDGGQHFGIRIHDHGIGMSPQELARVGERFYRADTAGSISGTGLGVTLVKEIVDVHGGEVEIDSKVGEGTVVTIWLPIVEESKTGRKEP